MDNKQKPKPERQTMDNTQKKWWVPYSFLLLFVALIVLGVIFAPRDVAPETPSNITRLSCDVLDLVENDGVPDLVVCGEGMSYTLIPFPGEK